MIFRVIDALFGNCAMRWSGATWTLPEWVPSTADGINHTSASFQILFKWSSLRVWGLAYGKSDYIGGLVTQRAIDCRIWMLRKIVSISPIVKLLLIMLTGQPHFLSVMAELPNILGIDNRVYLTVLLSGQQ